MPVIILGFVAAGFLLNRLGHWKDFEKKHPNYGAQNGYPPAPPAATPSSAQPKAAQPRYMPGVGWIAPNEPDVVTPEQMGVDEFSKPGSSQPGGQQ